MAELETAILEQLKVDRVSFGELARIDGFNGDKVITLGSNRNLVLWIDISAEAGAILQRLLLAGHFHFEPTDLITYLIDGAVPSLPIARQARQYKTPHWLPVVLRPGPGKIGRNTKVMRTESAG